MVGYSQSEVYKKLQNQITQTNLSKKIIITGYIHEHKQILRYARSSKILLFLDHEAGFGLVIAEAMAAGLPVICYDLPIFGSIYKNGFIKSPLKDTTSIANNIVNLLQNSKNYQILSNQAKLEAKKLDWKISSKRFYYQLSKLTA